MRIMVWLGITVVILVACGERQPAPIEVGAITYMTLDQWPETYQKLGADEFERANLKLPAVADYVARQYSCDRVLNVALSDAATRGHLSWYADCKDGTRFRVTEADLRQ